MRDVSKLVIGAFLEGRKRTIKNTSTDGQYLWLHGNRIAWRDEHGCIYMTMCGWPTVITRDRLNTLCHLLGSKLHFGQFRHEQYLVDHLGVSRKISANEVILANPGVLTRHIDELERTGKIAA